MAYNPNPIPFFVVLLLLFQISFSQSKPVITYGNLNNKTVSVDEFKNESGLKIPKGYTLDSATAFILIPGEYVQSVNYFPSFDSLNFNKYISLLYPGSWVKFDVVLTNKLTKKKDSVQVSYIFYGIKKDTAQKKPHSESYKELRWLQGLNYISGTIYLSGALHETSVTIVHIQGESNEAIDTALGRSGPGTKITFENVIYKDDQNNDQKLNMTFEYTDH